MKSSERVSCSAADHGRAFRTALGDHDAGACRCLGEVTRLPDGPRPATDDRVDDDR